MPRKLRCPRPINPILMMGRRGHQVFQRISNNVCAVAGARNIGGGGPGAVADFIAYAADNGGVLKGLVKGVGSFAFARATEASVITQPDGVVNTALPNELRFENGRRVGNSIAGSSEDNTNASWLTALPRTATTVTFGQRYDIFYQDIDTIEGALYTFSVHLRNISGNTRIAMYHGNSASGDFTYVMVDGTQKRFSVTVSGRVGGGNIAFGVQDRETSGWGELECTKWQVENVSGQVNQSPGDYVSVGVGTGSEEILNPNFTEDFTPSSADGWEDISETNGTATISGGELRLTGGNANPDRGWTETQVSVIANKTYIWTIVQSEDASGSLAARGGPSSKTNTRIGTTALNLGTNTIIYTATATETLYLGFNTNQLGTDGKISSASFKEADHGVNVDGVKYFNYGNNNSVDGNNIVNESKGATFSTVPRALYESFATTNLSNTNDDLTGGAETVTLAATGNHTLSVGGSAAVTVAAGTATGSGFGQATDGNPVTFNITGAGTVTLTLNSGTLGTADKGYVLKQVETGAIASSFVESPGGGGTRTADDGNPSFDFANWSQTEGTWYLDVWMSDPTLPQQSIFTIQNSYASVLYNESGQFRSNDGTSSARATVNAVVDQRFRVASDFGTGDTLECGSRNIDASGSWGFDLTPPNYDGAFETNSTMQIARSLTTPIRIAVFTGYKTRQGKQWIEDNL